jgi:AcrR family transcriptional regulator
MSLKGANPQRRRGRVLEEALLDATWAELTERGYDAFTIDAAAARAGTSRAVLYRRWPGKPELVHAALLHEAGKNMVVAPDTGTLRGDMIELMKRANEVRFRLGVEVFTRLGGFYREIGTNLAAISAAVLGNREPVLDGIIRRAIDRGEIAADRLTERITRLALDLFRYELLMTLEPVADDVIEEIVDTIFMPLVRPTD